MADHGRTAARVTFARSPSAAPAILARMRIRRCKAGHVPPGQQALDESSANAIGDVSKHDGHCALARRNGRTALPRER